MLSSAVRARTARGPFHRERNHRASWLIASLAFSVSLCGSAILATAGKPTGLPVPMPPIHTVAQSDFGMVATGSREASEVAVELLEMGGNAVDAAVAAALMLGVSDPDASGLGGISYMLIRFPNDRAIVIDGTPPTPRAVDAARLRELKDAGELFGHEVAGVPTTLAVLEHARARYGTMSLPTLIAPAIEIAERGYRLSPSLIVWTAYYIDELNVSGYLRGIAFMDGDRVGEVGEIACRPDLARTLRRIARRGVGTFYRGNLAGEIEADMIRGGGFLRKIDLAGYRVKEGYPLRTTYRGHDLLTFPPPGGGTSVIEILNILESFPKSFVAEDSVARHHALLETFRIAQNDRGLVQNLVDPLWTAPSPALIMEHARSRAELISPARVIPDSDLRGPIDPECAPIGETTTQVSVVDQWGTVVSLTQTLGRSWGAKVATPGLGFPHNSLLETFNFDKPQCPGYLQPNIPCPTDMAPTILLAEDGSLKAALGTPGSNLIPAIIANVVSNLVDREMGLEEAIAAPRVLFGGLEALAPYIELAAPITEKEVEALEAIGHAKVERYSYPAVSRGIVLYGGVNAVGWDAEAMTFVGVGDGRRWGSAMGPRVVAELQPVR